MLTLADTLIAGMIKLNLILDKSWEFWFEWTCTIVLLAGVILTSFNIYPLNIWILLVGNLGWIALGYLWKKWSLFVLQTIITLIYVAGIIKLYI